MKKRFTKIICIIVGLIAALGVCITAGCSAYNRKPLVGENIFTDAAAVSNGGFAVEKGGYIYFINGVESNTVNNDFGNPVKGSVHRISTADFAAHNYQNTDCVVPLVAYTEDYDAGIFVYGDYVYYATPSTDKTADGKVQNDMLDLKRTKLDGSTTMSKALVTFANKSVKYRFVEVDKTVYLLYVATSEKLYDESTGVTNLHSYNVETGVDTVLAYNVDTVLFDKDNKENPRVYFTMNVKDYSTDSNYGYNQVYAVNADATVNNFAETDFSVLEGWNSDEDNGEVDRYINCGKLVFDGIGKDVTAGSWPFNYDKTGATTNNVSYTYKLTAYTNETLFYTRTAKLPSANTAEALYSVKDETVTADDWDAVTGNAAETGAFILRDAKDADKFTYIFDAGGSLDKVILTDSDGGIYVNTVVGGKLCDKTQKGTANYYPVVKGGTCTILFTDGNDLYYSVSGGAGYTFNRVDYTGVKDKYGVMPVEDEYDNYRPVKILNLDACSDWYMPELIEGQLIFASEIDSSNSSANYIVAFDLHSREDGKLMDNAAIHTLNKQYEGVSKHIDEFGDTEKYDEKTYANITGALKYAYLTGESADVYLKGLAEKCNAEALKADEKADLVYSEETLAKYAEFLAPAEGNDWAEYTASIKVNGKDVYANSRNYYFAMMGEATAEDAEAYGTAVKAENLKAMPEEKSWYESLSTVAKVFFIIGMCLIGLLVIAAVVVPVTVIMVRRKKALAPVDRKKKIKVDTTDDKNIDVYSD